MSASTKLSTSVKALCVLARSEAPKTSSEIAQIIGINASKLRKLLSMLGKSGIVKSDSGMKGGFTLSKKTDEIHLQEIYCAIEDRKAFHLNVNKEKSSKKSISEQVNSIFLDLFVEIQIDIENKMKNITLKSLLDKIN
jgi:Rrf2 family protein